MPDVEGNDRRLLQAVISDLVEAGISALVFGGWAEELQAMATARPHRDIDLLLIDPGDTVLEEFLSKRHEIKEKRFSHKRALVVSGVLIELFIARRKGDELVTCFWDQLLWKWPRGLEATVADLPVASEPALVAYRRDWASIHAHRPSSSL